jgi:hypothetical protein
MLLLSGLSAFLAGDAPRIALDYGLNSQER